MKPRWLVVALVAFAGCKEAPRPTVADTIKTKRTFKDEMRKCKTVKCAQDISDRYTLWAVERRNDPALKYSVDEAKQEDAISEELSKCLRAAMGIPTAEAPLVKD
jgi:hypothetical protein